ncbi:hypothetical protein [Pseudorhodoferax sp. Leaf267]|nr:hypothetical protein [Pseudorhodoferax sp. Leaf267]
MEPINWLLFAVFIVIVVWKLIRQRGGEKPPSHRQDDPHQPR